MSKIPVLFAMLLLLAGCVDKAEKTATETAAATTETAADEPGAAQTTAPVVEVLETMDAGGYTYVRFEGTDGDEWAAASQTKIAVGDRILKPSGMVMKDFTSKTLDRTFPEIYFVGGYTRVDEQGQPIGGAATSSPMGSAMSGGMGMGAGATGAAMSGINDHTKVGSLSEGLDLSGITKATGGHTLGELYGLTGSLNGQQVLVRGKVVKATKGVMGTNWYHIEDGSGAEGHKDLTVTSDALASVGDLVLVKGTAAENKDFGAGYKYDLIIENADLTVESH